MNLACGILMLEAHKPLNSRLIFALAWPSFVTPALRGTPMHAS